MAAPKVGAVVDGYYFKGGDPNAKDSWVEFSPEKPSFLESVGRGAADVTQGIRQAALQFDESISPKGAPFAPKTGTAAGYTAEKEGELALYERHQGGGLDAGRLVGNIAATVPTALIGGGGPMASILRAGASGALAGGAHFVPEGESRGANAALGGILGAGLQSLPAGYQAIKNAAKPSATMARAATTAEKLGVRPTPAQATGSRTLQRLEAGMENTAGGGLAMEQLGRANQSAVNKEIVKRLGQTGDKLDRATLGKALDAINAKYNSALGSVTLRPDSQFVDDLAKIGTEFSAPGTKLPAAIRDAIDDPRFLEPMKAVDYNRARSLYGRNAIEAYRGGRATEAQAWDALQEAVDEMAKRNLPPPKAAALDSAREGFRILKTVEKAADPVTGNVSPPKLVTAMRQKDPRSFLYGKGQNPLSDVVDASAFLKQPPDSFTASRAGMMLAPSIIGGAYGGYEGGAEGAAKGAILGTALPYALTRGYLGITKPQSILGAGAQRGINYLIPAIGSTTAQP